MLALRQPITPCSPSRVALRTPGLPAGFALDRCARRDRTLAGNPAQELSSRIPHECHSRSFVFIPCERVHPRSCAGGRAAAGAGRVRSRSARGDEPAVHVHSKRTGAHRPHAGWVHARHIVRLRRRLETVQLRDAVPEIPRSMQLASRQPWIRPSKPPTSTRISTREHRLSPLLSPPSPSRPRPRSPARPMTIPPESAVRD